MSTVQTIDHVRHVRKYQKAFYQYLVSHPQGGRSIEIAHRRWGKDEICLMATAELALQRPAGYWHCLPEYAQARKAIWEAVNPHTGRRRIEEAFPKPIIERMDSQAMFIEFKNGSTWQLIGSDRYDATVGSSPAGIVYSEWALANPSAWGYHRPMVEENSGWATFITTPRGKNHAHAMYEMAKEHPNWFAEVSPVTKTGALTSEQLKEALDEYIAIYGDDFGLAYYEQEYLCSFSGAMVGAIFGGELARAEREGRVCDVPIDRRYPVHTAWDLGLAHNNPVWCFQVLPGDVGPRIVDFYLPDDDDIETWCHDLKERGYDGYDYVPHDILTTDWGSKRTRIDTLKALGRKPRRIGKVSLQDGINAGNQTLKVCTIDQTRCEEGLEGLRNYRRAWDDQLKVFRANPVKDKSEHIGSAFRYLGLAWRDALPEPVEREKPKELEFVAHPDGTVTSNMSVKDAVEAMVKRKRRDDW